MWMMSKHFFECSFACAKIDESFSSFNGSKIKIKISYNLGEVSWPIVSKINFCIFEFVCNKLPTVAIGTNYSRYTKAATRFNSSSRHTFYSVLQKMFFFTFFSNFCLQVRNRYSCKVSLSQPLTWDLRNHF